MTDGHHTGIIYTLEQHEYEMQSAVRRALSMYLPLVFLLGMGMTGVATGFIYSNEMEYERKLCEHRVQEAISKSKRYIEAAKAERNKYTIRLEQFRKHHE